MIYLDHNATTPVDPRVVGAMLPMFTRDFANASSKHAAGQKAAARVERARHQVADLVGTRRRSIVFTSGATEAANLAIRGAMAAAGPHRRRILVAATEHKAVLAAAEAAAAETGGKADLIGVLTDGTLDFAHLRRLLSEANDVALVAVAAANNETGAINDVRNTARLAHEAGALFFCDIAQAAGKIPVRLDEWGVDMAVWSAHKLYGPKGVGALAADRPLQARLAPLIAGGGQERGLRSGTVDTAGIVGFGEASRLAAQTLAEEARRQRDLMRLFQRLLVGRLAHTLPAIEVNGPALDKRLANTVNLRFVGVEADALLSCLSGVMISSGAACGDGDSVPSHVLLAMGVSEEAAAESLRISVGRTTTEKHIRTAAGLIADAVQRVRSLPAHRQRVPGGPHTGPQPGGQTGPRTGPRTGPQPGAQAGPRTGPPTGPRTGPQAGPRTGPQMGARTTQQMGAPTGPQPPAHTGPQPGAQQRSAYRSTAVAGLTGAQHQPAFKNATGGPDQ